jgi:hypothetical protein
VDGVPVGSVTVSFLYHVTADMLDSLNREARVVDGKETEVRFEGHPGAWKQPLRLIFDDQERIPAYKGLRKVENVTDRAPMFVFKATALGAGPASGTHSSDWSANEKAGPAIDDLSPGRWRFGVCDWLGSEGYEEGSRAETVAEIGRSVPRLPSSSVAGRSPAN